MSDRRTVLLDAAVDVVGSAGLRALTHRAVDAAAGLPAGAASNVFRRRSDLVTGLLERLIEREVAGWLDLVAAAEQTAPAASREARVDHTAALVAGMVGTLVGPARAVTLARHAVFQEAALDPELQRRVIEARARLSVFGREWLTRLGLRVDAAGTALLLATVNGMVATTLAGPDPDLDPEAALRTVLDAVAAPEPLRQRDDQGRGDAPVPGGTGARSPDQADHSRA